MTAAGRTLQAQVHVDAPPAAVWNVVSDVRRTGEWSPECFRVIPFGRKAVGSTFVGLNRRGAMVWPTTSRVVELVDGRRIAWTVQENASTWSYDVQPDPAGGTLLTQRRELPRGITPFARAFTRLFLGGEAHDDELEQGMEQGLRTIARIVEQV